MNRFFRSSICRSARLIRVRRFVSWSKPPPPPRHWAPPPRRDGNHAQFVDSFETSTEVQLVLELLSGGTLLGLLERWDAGELPMSVPLKRVEQLIDEGVLQPDVLMLPPDEYHDYHYDHDD